MKKQFKTICSRAPLRLSLAGGGTDVSPYYNNYGGVVLNATIDKYAYTVVKPSIKGLIKFKSIDKNLEEIFDPNNNVNKPLKLKLHSCAYIHMMKHYNNNNYVPLKITTYCDAPIGSGLGSSSTIVVSIIKALAKFLKLSFDQYKIANIAYLVERKDCKLKGGRQDHYAAAFGGINLIKFYKNDKVKVNKVTVKDHIISQLETSFLLYFTGISRNSEKIINKQSINISKKKSASLKAMHGIKAETMIIKKALLNGNFKILVKSMRKSWVMKKKIVKGISNNHLNRVYKKAIEAGAYAGKISGAGGGGFMLFYVPIDSKERVKKTLIKFGGKINNCNFTKKGSEAWSI